MRYILSKLYPQAVSHLVHTSIELVYPGCFPVGIGSHGSLGGNRMRADLVPWALKKRVVGKGYGEAIATGHGCGAYEALFFAWCYPLARLLLQDDEVTTDLGPRVL